MTDYNIPQNRTILKAMSSCPIWIKLFLFSMLLPSEFSVALGSVRLSVYKVVLVCAFFPMLFKYIAKKDIKFSLADFLVLFHLSWTSISLLVNHGLDFSIEPIGSRIIDFGGAYLLARVYVRNVSDFDSVIAVSLVVMSILLPILIFESVTGQYIVHKIASSIVGQGFYVDLGQRLGLTRAMGPFDHPILLGVIAASFFSLVWARFSFSGKASTKRYIASFVVFISAASSLSSSSLLVLAGQMGLMGWNWLLEKVRFRWKLLVFLLVFVLLGIEFLSNRSALKVLISYLTFSSHTAYYRLAIYEAGWNNVLANPLFGIGFDDWERPGWLAASVDSFWLLQMMQFGLPGGTSSALLVLVALVKSNHYSGQFLRYKFAWVISIVSLVVAGFTVHFWGTAFVFFSFILGCGIWYSKAK